MLLPAEDVDRLMAMFNYRKTLSLSVLSLLLLAAPVARAQFGGPTNRANSGGFGQQSVSNGAFGSRTLGGSSIGTPNRSAMGGQTSMFGGGGGRAGGGMTQGSGAAGNQIGSQQISGNEWFVPGNRQAGQFVGSDSQDAANFIGAFSQLTGVNQGQFGRGQMGRGQMGMNQFGQGQFGQGQRGMQRGQQNFGQGGRQQGRGNRNGRQSSATMLTTFVPGFSYSSAAPQTVGQKLASQLTASRSVAATGPVQVQMDGRIAVLRGTVATESARDLAARIAMLEPGVSEVRNELTVEPELPSPSSTSRSSQNPAQTTPRFGQ